MAVFRVEKTGDYTVMCNHHLKNIHLSLRAKGLLSLMLSLPEDWDYTLKGIARISLEGIDAIRKAIRELEAEGYIIRSRVRNEKGQLTDAEYVIYEKPVSAQSMQAEPIQAEPAQEKPVLENPMLDTPTLEKSTQLNINILNTNSLSTNLSNPILSNPCGKKNSSDRNGLDGIELRERYQSVILENLDYNILCQREDVARLDEIVELMLDTVCTSRKSVRIAGDDYSADVVKSRLLKLTSAHVEYVFDCLKNNATRVRNIRQYLLASLFNAPATIDNYYSAMVNHDLYGT